MSLVPASSLPSTATRVAVPLNPRVEIEEIQPIEQTERKIIRRGESGMRTLGFVGGLAGGYVCHTL
jgi:hypothetical protein